jgi:hypothetical protein
LSPGVLHRAAGGFQLIVENEIGLRTDLAIGAQQERRSVQIESGAVGGAGVPAETDQRFLEVRRLLAQRQSAAFVEGNKPYVDPPLIFAVYACHRWMAALP